MNQKMEIVYDFKKMLHGIAIDAEDNIFVANYGNNSIDRVSLRNGKFSIIQSIKISSPQVLAINSKNEIYIGTAKREIKKMTKEGIISTIAENRTRGIADQIGIVYTICFDENDIAYFSDANSYSIRKLTPDGKITTLCGGEDSGFSDGKGEKAEFDGLRGIVYNRSSKIFYITDSFNKSIRTMTVDGDVGTLCKYSHYLQGIAIDGEGKLYVSTNKKISEGGEGIISVDSKGEIKQINIKVTDCYGIAFNSKGDLFFSSYTKLCVIRNCTKYPAHPTTNANMNSLEIQSTNNIQLENQELKKQLAATQKQLYSVQVELADTKKILSEVQKEIQDSKKSETEQQNKKRKLKQEIPELESEEETTEEPGSEVLKWLSSIQLDNLFPILQDIGAKNLEFLKLLEENDLEGKNIKLLEKRKLFQSIKKLE